MHGTMGRTWALAWAALFLTGGALLLARQMGWLALDWGLVGAIGLLALGALFLAAAIAMPRRADHEDADCAPHQGWQWSGRYWMVVMAGFFLLMAANLGSRTLGLAAPGWSIAGPYWLAAVGGMFLLRALAPRREAES